MNRKSAFKSAEILHASPIAWAVRMLLLAGLAAGPGLAFAQTGLTFSQQPAMNAGGAIPNIILATDSSMLNFDSQPCLFLSGDYPAPITIDGTTYTFYPQACSSNVSTV